MGDTVRIIVALDVEAKTPEEAYKKLYAAMPLLHSRGIDWESTDEWYDVDGEPLDVETISAARLRTLPGV
jgi:hypothetical protein